jgi:hypothetical protein
MKWTIDRWLFCSQVINADKVSSFQLSVLTYLVIRTDLFQMKEGFVNDSHNNNNNLNQLTYKA